MFGQSVGHVRTKALDWEVGNCDGLARGVIYFFTNVDVAQSRRLRRTVRYAYLDEVGKERYRRGVVRC